MWASRYFADRYFAKRYFSKLGAVIIFLIPKPTLRNRVDVNIVDNLAEDSLMKIEVETFLINVGIP